MGLLSAWFKVKFAGCRQRVANWFPGQVSGVGIGYCASAASVAGHARLVIGCLP